jgi:hypothetical protein
MHNYQYHSVRRSLQMPVPRTSWLLPSAGYLRYYILSHFATYIVGIAYARAWLICLPS